MGTKRILLPTDFSENSWNAISYVLQLFSDERCEFYLLNTYTPVIYHVEYVLVNPAQFGRDDPIRENSLRCLQTMHDRIKDEFPNPLHTIKTMAAFNTLIPEIKDVVADKEIDLIVMGTKGATGAKEVLFGSNTVHVFKAVDCPVMAIPVDFTFESPQEILFPSDLKVQYTDEQLIMIKELVKARNARIHLVHVLENNGMNKAQENNMNDIMNRLGDCSILFHELEDHSVPEAISNFQQRAKINLLVMINNKHSFFENLFFRPTISQIGFHLNVPFLVIPST